MDANDHTARDGGWGAVLDGVAGASADAGAAAPRRDVWPVITALVDRSSGGAATAAGYARIVTQIDAFVPSELHHAAETLLHVAGGTSSWAGAVVDAAPGPPAVTGAPELPHPPDAARAPDPPRPPDVPTPPPSARPDPRTAPEPAPVAERAPVVDDTFPDDPTFDAAIAASVPAEHPSEVTT